LAKDDTTLSEKREAALRAAMSKLEKNFGQGTVSILGEAPTVPVDIVPSGSLAIDIALGRGGLPKGRIIEIWGPESSGKTLFCLHAMAQEQKAGGRAAFIDAEHAFDADWAKKIGVDTDALVFSQPDSGEDAFEVLETLVNSGAVDIIIVDSVAALVPRKELEGDFGDATMGVQARMMSQGLRKITGAVKKNNVTVIFINQVREKIGVMFGSPKTTTGGNALKFYASIRMEIARIETLKEGTDPIGARTRVKVVKNKVAPPFKTAEFDILWKKGDEGYSRESDIRDFGIQAEVIKRSGAWFTSNIELTDPTTGEILIKKGDQLGQGAEKARVFLKENPRVTDALEIIVRDKFLNTGEAELDEIAAHERDAE
jgi:recombination protein RecA